MECVLKYDNFNKFFRKFLLYRELQERKTENGYCSDLSLSFVEEYLKSKLLGSDRKLLVIKAGYGGSGFALRQIVF